MADPSNVQNFYNEELKRVQEKQKNATSILDSQHRLAELNNGYRKRYAKYVEVLVVLILTYSFYLGVITLQKMFPAISQFMVDIVTMVLIFLIAAYLFITGWELYNRSIINYDELDMPVIDSSGVDINGSITTSGDGTINSVVDCSGGIACCGEGTIYNNGKCIPDGAKPTLKQNFTTIEDAYKTQVSFNSPLLKREQNAQDITPLQDKTNLVYSNF